MPKCPPQFPRHRVQRLLSLGTYSGLQTGVQAEGTFLQLSSVTGLPGRLVYIGITDSEFIVVMQNGSQANDTEEADLTGLAMDFIFPLSLLRFSIADDRSKQFTVCTCVGLLLYFEMCQFDSYFENDWRSWRQKLLELGAHKADNIGFQIWRSHRLLELVGVPRPEEFLTYRKKNSKTFTFVKQKFGLKRVDSVGVQTDPVIIQDSSSKHESQYSHRIPSGLRNLFGGHELKTPKEEIARQKQQMTPSPTSPPFLIKMQQKEEATFVRPEKRQEQNVQSTRIHTSPTIAAKRPDLAEKCPPLVSNEIKVRRKPRLPVNYKDIFCSLYRSEKVSASEFTGTESIRRSFSCGDLVASGGGSEPHRFHHKLLLAFVARQQGRSWGDSFPDNVLTSLKKVSKVDDKPIESLADWESSDSEDDIEEAMKTYHRENNEHSSQRGKTLWDIAKQRLFRRKQTGFQEVANVVFLQCKPGARLQSMAAKTLDDIPVFEMATELTYRNRKLLMAIKAGEIQNYAASDSNQIAGNIQRLQSFNVRVSRMVTLEILKVKTPFSRAKLIRYFEQVCIFLLKWRDYQSLAAVIRGVVCLPLVRLHETWDVYRKLWRWYFDNLLRMVTIFGPGHDGMYPQYCSRLRPYTNIPASYIPWLDHFLWHIQANRPVQSTCEGNPLKPILSKTPQREKKGLLNGFFKHHEKKHNKQDSLQAKRRSSIKSKQGSHSVLSRKGDKTPNLDKKKGHKKQSAGRKRSAHSVHAHNRSVSKVRTETGTIFVEGSMKKEVIPRTRPILDNYTMLKSSIESIPPVSSCGAAQRDSGISFQTTESGLERKNIKSESGAGDISKEGQVEPNQTRRDSLQQTRRLSLFEQAEDERGRSGMNRENTIENAIELKLTTMKQRGPLVLEWDSDEDVCDGKREGRNLNLKKGGVVQDESNNSPKVSYQDEAGGSSLSASSSVSSDCLLSRRRRSQRHSRRQTSLYDTSPTRQLFAFKLSAGLVQVTSKRTIREGLKLLLASDVSDFKLLQMSFDIE